MKKVYVSWNDVQRQVQELVRQMWIDRWTPDYVVGITRGGLVPANLISQYLDCTMYALQVRLRDGQTDDCESNLWMAEDALGPSSRERYVENPVDVAGILEAASDLLEQGATYKNILIVDDINDTGATFNWIMNDWPSGCFPNDDSWDEVWNNNVKFAVVVDNLASNCTVKMDYVGKEINKAENDVWVDFPWEDWWTK